MLKVYYGSRGLASCWWKSFENVVLAGQTSYLPRTRLRVERECLRVWREHGFRVFETFEDVEVRAPRCPPGGYLLFEYRPGPRLVDVLRDEARPLERRMEVYRRFLGEWGRRHRMAVAERDPRLVHENGDGKHVMILDDGLLWFDFEMVFRRPERIRECVSHEIVQYLWHLLKNTPAAVGGRLLDETVAGYPEPELLRATYDAFFRHPNPLQRLGRALDRRLFARAKKPNSKYNVVRRLREKLGPA